MLFAATANGTVTLIDRHFETKSAIAALRGVTRRIFVVDSTGLTSVGIVDADA